MNFACENQNTSDALTDSVALTTARDADPETSVVES